MQAVRGGVPGAGDYHRFRSPGRTAPVAPPDTTSTLFKCIFCGFCEEACPVDSIVETSIYEYHFEKREEADHDQGKLLAIGDRYEAQIASDRMQDALYR